MATPKINFNEKCNTAIKAIQTVKHSMYSLKDTMSNNKAVKLKTKLFEAKRIFLFEMQMKKNLKRKKGWKEWTFYIRKYKTK